MNVIVLGNGRSGKAASELLVREGCLVQVLDGDDQWPEGTWDLCVTSPGVPLDHPWRRSARAAKVRVISELQLGAERYKALGGRMLAVTGSKGKSSVVKLVADALDGIPCGNYGKPLCEVVLDAMDRVDGGELIVDSGLKPVAVVEVSSFQMETTDLPSDTFEAAAILNLQEDHLDRHGSAEVYHALKRRLLDFAVVKIDGEVVRGNAYDELFEESYFDNPILRGNGRCAVALMQAAGLGDESIKAAFRRFEPLPHRMQTVGEFAGVTYIDDSKATSISALVAGVTMAISRFSASFSSEFSDFTGSLPSSHLPDSQLSTLNSQLNHVRLIAGGLPKGDDPGLARGALSKGVAKVYLIGQCAEAFEDAWEDVVPCEVCGDIETAVRRAKEESSNGDCILLSPGTASFDQFKSYGERGDRFTDLAGCR